MRASQINGCAYCIDMHWKDARAAGETEQRLYGLAAWREAPYYSERERAALAWTEELTLIAEHHVSDELYEQTRRQFSEQELVDLTLAVVTINAWNRIAISFRSEAGLVPAARRAHRQMSQCLSTLRGGRTVAVARLLISIGVGSHASCTHRSD